MPNNNAEQQTPNITDIGFGGMFQSAEKPAGSLKVRRFNCTTCASRTCCKAVRSPDTIKN